MDAELDVVVIGGGIQGLLALDALRDRGVSTALVTDGELGEGQTIHSHGFLNTGFGMLGDGPVQTSHDVVQPFLRSRGIEPTGDWRVIPPPAFPSMAPAAPLPGGFDTALSAAALASPDRNFPKRPLVEALAAAHRNWIVQGRASIGDRTDDARIVVVQGPDGDMRVAARCVIAAAGCGTKALLEQLVGRTPQVDSIKHRRVHMICLRAPHGVLPAVSVVVMPLGLMLVAHDDGAVVTWYVTPMEFGGAAFDDVPCDAASAADLSMLARGFGALRQLYPALNDADGVRIGSYAGYRQDVGDMPGMPMCEPVTGAEDVIVALPSGLVPAWTNTARILELVGERAAPRGSVAALPATDRPIPVSRPVEERAGFEWLTVEEFAQRVGGVFATIATRPGEAQPSSSSAT